MFGDPLLGITTMPKMSLKMKIIAKGKRTGGVTRYLKATFFSHLGWSGPSNGERDVFKMRVTAKGKCVKLRCGAKKGKSINL